MALVTAGLLAFSGWRTAAVSLLAFPFLFVLAYTGYAGTSGASEAIGYVGRSFVTACGDMLLIYVLAIPSMWLIDTVMGRMIFNFLDWVIYADDLTIDNMNVRFQAVTYLFFFSVMFILLSVSFALTAYKLREIAGAEALLEEIDRVGTKRRLRGMEVE